MTQIQVHVDLERGILYDTLLQVRKTDEAFSFKNPDLVQVWVGEVDPKKGKLLMVFLKKYCRIDESSQIAHFKRIRKVDDHLQVLLCQYESEVQAHEIREMAGQVDPEFVINNLDVIGVPRNAPPTKEMTLNWSETYWPITWKGNPNHQFLNSVTFDIEEERDMVNKLLDSLDGTSSSAEHALLGTLIARQVCGKLEVCTLQSNQGYRSNNPKSHSVMRAIAEIADQELENRKNKEYDRGYLCTDLIVYTSHEPCVMCCMALVHSRIGRVTYINTVKNSGALESHYNLGDVDGLNWKFQIWKWLGADEALRLDQINRGRLSCIEY